MSKVDIDKLLELEAKATPATWRHDGKTTVYVGQYDTPYWETYKSAYSDGKYELDYCADGKLIAAMRNSIRELCLELKAARNCVEVLENIEEFAWSDDRDKAEHVLARYREVTNGSTETLGK